MNKQISDTIKASRALSPVAIMSGDATYTSQTIDTAGHESTMFVIMSGALTDGTYTCDLYGGDASNMSDEAVCTQPDMLGQAPAFTFNKDTEDNTVKKVQYIGTKRYVRLKIVQASSSTGGYINAVAIQANARKEPV